MNISHALRPYSVITIMASNVCSRQETVGNNIVAVTFAAKSLLFGCKHVKNYPSTITAAGATGSA